MKIPYQQATGILRYHKLTGDDPVGDLLIPQGFYERTINLTSWRLFLIDSSRPLTGELLTEGSIFTYPYLIRDSGNHLIIVTLHASLIRRLLARRSIRKHLYVPRVRVAELTNHYISFAQSPPQAPILTIEQDELFLGALPALQPEATSQEDPSSLSPEQGHPKRADDATGFDEERIIQRLFPYELYSVSALYASVLGFGDAISSLSVFGKNLTSTPLIQDMVNQLSPYRIEIAEAHGRLKTLSVTSNGDFSFYYSGLPSLRRVVKAVHHLSNAHYIQWPRPR